MRQVTHDHEGRPESPQSKVNTNKIVEIAFFLIQYTTSNSCQILILLKLYSSSSVWPGKLVGLYVYTDILM